jgi:hypothetical protein
VNNVALLIDVAAKLQAMQKLCALSDAELRLMCGELSAQELRAVRAVLDVIKGIL